MTDTISAGDIGQDVYSLLVPLEGQRLLVPRTCVAEVVGYHEPEQRAGTPPWFLGTLNWSGREIPCVSFELAMGIDVPEGSSRSRVVVFNAIGGSLMLPYFGVVAQGFPQLVRVNADVLQADPESDFDEDSPVICRLRMLNERPLIPDLERLEMMIHEVQALVSD